MNKYAPKSTTENQQAKPEGKLLSSRHGLSADVSASLVSVLVDNRPQAIAQRKFQAMADQHPQGQRLAQAPMQAMVDNSPRQVAQRQQLEQLFVPPAQRQAELDDEELQMRAAPDTLQRQGLEDEELLQGKMTPVQRQGELEEEELLQSKVESIQRQGLEDEELLQGKMAPVQRQEDLEEDELLQGKFEPVQRQDLKDEDLVQGKFATSETPTQRQEDEDTVVNRTGMPDQLKEELERLSVMDLSGVRVHHNSSKPAQLNALAYAQGQDIHLGPGQERHLPHEGWHAVQQMQGRVKPTMQAKGVSINDDEALEHEADVMQAKVMQMRHAGKSAFEFSIHSNGNRVAVGLASSAAFPVQRALEGSCANLYKEDHTAVTLKKQLTDDLPEGSQWWVSSSYMERLLKGENVRVDFCDGNCDDSYVSDAVLGDLTWELSDSEKEQVAQEERIKQRRESPNHVQGFRTAVERHNTDRAAVKTVLDANHPEDPALRNSVTMINSGDVKLWVMTSTHDEDERASKNDEAGKGAYFMAVDILTDVPEEPYRWYDPSDDYNITFYKKNSAGMNVSGSTDIYLINPSMWPEMGVTTTIAKIIKHEVQHAVDFNAPEQGAGWRQYKTEYRAYLVAREFEDENDEQTTETVRGVSGFTQRQKSICEHILANYADADAAWNADEFSGNVSFRELVLEYRGSINELSPNPINSPRLHVFLKDVSALGKSKLDDANTTTFLDKHLPEGAQSALDANDKEVIASGETLGAMLAKYLDAEVVNEVKRRAM